MSNLGLTKNSSKVIDFDQFVNPRGKSERLKDEPKIKNVKRVEVTITGDEPTDANGNIDIGDIDFSDCLTTHGLDHNPHHGVGIVRGAGYTSTSNNYRVHNSKL